MNQNMLGIVVTEFSSDISEAMLTAALDEAAVLGAEIVTVSHVRGAYEIPLITEELLTKITDPTLYPLCIHGTYEKAWALIKNTGKLKESYTGNRALTY